MSAVDPPGKGISKHSPKNWGGTTTYNLQLVGCGTESDYNPIQSTTKVTEGSCSIIRA